VHSAGLLDEHPAVRRQRHVAAEDAAQSAAATTAGVVGQIHLGELEGISKECEISRGARGCERIGERKLAGLIDSQDVYRGVGQLVIGWRIATRCRQR
jgi:hypothetical protein